MIVLKPGWGRATHNDIQTKKRLTPADFKTQLWFGLVATGNRHMLPREPIEWGQPFVAIKITVDAKYIGGLVFDRDDGGEPLGGGAFDDGIWRMRVGDTAHINLAWTGTSNP